ncbi:TolC family protein [Echinicola jeungdonensis]|uniref:TolC family protein n=1 Tax=Echinicola jeungdonensis TaxID=709343 RepID=A0ABV5J7H9_9BACT|nr:TolC family protein [Echinicola jeungdonensis]MDN3669761.1 TolC family protein [Echinicola jeungdonensis]
MKAVNSRILIKILTLGLSFQALPFLALAQTDSTDVIKYDQFIQQVLQYHPKSKQAQLKDQEARAVLRSARGNFDPVLSSNLDQKHYDDKLYYRLFESELRLPTRLGVDLVGGFGKSSGQYINPEHRTGSAGLINAGIEINVLQGLLMDEGRTELKKAKSFQELAQNQQTNQLNELIYKATEAYLVWQRAYSSMEVVEESIQIAREYFENTKISFFNGEKTAVDTLEAYIILQDRQNLLQSTSASLVEAEQYLENYLWEEGNPNILDPSATPQKVDEKLFVLDEADRYVDSLQNHPLILEKVNQKNIYEASRRLKREKLLPKLKLKYMPLLTPSESGEWPSYTRSDYKWGFSFSFPLLIRKARGDYQQSAIKVRNTQLEIDNKRNELYNSAITSLNQLDLIRNQVVRQKQNIKGYAALLEAENEKFNFGESSVFLINKRQEKLLEGHLKLIDLHLKMQLVSMKYLYYTNNLMEQVEN